MTVERSIYVDEFFDSYCAADILPYYGNFMSARERNKEITESMACLHGALDYLSLDRKASKVVIMVIGDGKYPRTGALFAFFTSWTVLSIDPIMDMEFNKHYTQFKSDIGRPIQRLNLFPMKFEEMSQNLISLRDAELVVVLPHSHILFQDMVDKVATFESPDYEYAVVSLPCCVALPPQLVSKKAFDITNFISYTDPNVRSEKRNMVIHKHMSKTIFDKLVAKRKVKRWRNS